MTPTFLVGILSEFDVHLGIEFLHDIPIFAYQGFPTLPEITPHR
jgi:hypothetical protein